MDIRGFHIGLMKTVVKFEKNVPVGVSQTSSADNYEEFLTTRGYLYKKNGRRVDEFGEVGISSNWFCRVRFQTDLENELNKSVRLVANNRFYAIQSYNLVEEKKRYYDLELADWE